MIIFSCQNQIFDNDIIFSCPWFRIRIKRHKTTAQQHHLNFGLRSALHLSKHVWAEEMKHSSKIPFFNYEKLTTFFYVQEFQNYLTEEHKPDENDLKLDSLVELLRDGVCLLNGWHHIDQVLLKKSK